MIGLWLFFMLIPAQVHLNYEKNVPEISIGDIFEADGKVVTIDYRW